LKLLSFLAAGVSFLALATAAQAAEEPAPQDQPVATRDEGSDVEALIVFGRAEQRIGEAVAASEGALAGADLTLRPFLRTAEMLESVPGMIVTQHSGSGKANQYFLRGFNLDHGTDFGLTIDGVPMNFRTHGHGPGYLDINGLIPEVVERIDYRKGPYRADLGDFNLVGGGIISTKDDLDAPFGTVEWGDDNYKRIVAGGSFQALGGTVLLMGQGKTYDGPWALPEDLQHISLYGKHSIDTRWGTLRTSLSIYDATWQPTEQIPERAIGVLIPDAFGAIDTTLHGRTERQILSTQLEGMNWRGNLYVQHYDWAMTQNFTFFLDDPVNGDQIEQAEKLWTYGGRLERRIDYSDALKFNVGGEFRIDDIDEVGLFSSVNGVRTTARRLDKVRESSAAIYAEANWKVNDKFSVTGGLRGDHYHFDDTALGGTSTSGEEKDQIFSPKIGVSYILADGIAAYANWGQGFHSNDARGVTAAVSPAPGLVKGEGKEVGLRYERHKMVATATYWWMDVDSELIYVGDSGSVEPSSASTRHGFELTMFWRPLPGLAIDGVWAHSNARFVDSPGAEFIPGAIEDTAEFGVTYITDKWNMGARWRYLGEHPLVEDDSVRSEPTTIVNLRAAWTPTPRWELYGELLNALDSDDKDIEYLYESYLPAIDLAPVEDVHSRAVEPRMIRLGVKKSF